MTNGIAFEGSNSHYDGLRVWDARVLEGDCTPIGKMAY